MSSAATDGPLSRWKEQVRSGAIRFDAAQEQAVERLQRLHEALRDYRPAIAGQGWLSRLGLSRRSAAPQGIYLLGDVGRGKTLLMDLFFEGAPVGAKRRVHFHAFMQEIHTRLHALRSSEAAGPDTLLPRLAREIATATWLLCFDELQVDNIVDAMLLGRLFAALLAHGVVVVTTSNTAPERLYEGGLQRELFLPFIALIRERLDVARVEGPRDYRLDRLQGMRVYLTPLDDAADRALADIFRALTDDEPPHAAEIPLTGRTLIVPRAAKSVAWFTFAELCEQPLGAADYIALARSYATLVVSGIPRLDRSRIDAALRFVTLVDAMYEQHAKLICSAVESPDMLFDVDARAEFRRATSRLHEMQSAEYLAHPHGR